MDYIDKAKAYEHFAEKALIFTDFLASSSLDYADREIINAKLESLLQAKFYIMDMPSANVKEIIYAHWILEREPDGNPYCYHCSHCDADFHNIGIKCASKYCPDCGAIMSERIEDNGKID